MAELSRALTLIFDFVKYCVIMALLHCCKVLFNWDLSFFLRRWLMGKKKDKKSKSDKIRTFEDALRLIFSNTVPKEQQGVMVVELVPEPDFIDEPEEQLSDLEATRQEIFEMMTAEELAACDLLDTFVHTAKAGLPEDDGSLEARVEHADWNTDEYRLEIADMLAELEAEIAYYSYIRNAFPNDDAYIEVCLIDIQDYIDMLVKEARVLELSQRLEVLDYEAERSQKVCDDAKIEREIVFDQLQELYNEIYDDTIEAIPEDEREN